MVPAPKDIAVVDVVKNPSPISVTVACCTPTKPKICPGKIVKVEVDPPSLTVTTSCPLAGTMAKELPAGIVKAVTELNWSLTPIWIMLEMVWSCVVN